MKVLFIILIIFNINLYSELYDEVTFNNKVENINKIAGKIWATVGVAYPPPEIKVHNEKIYPDLSFSMASFEPSKNKIHIGIEFYDKCMEIGEAAFAVVLGHEMGHYFNAHKSFVGISGFIISEKESQFISEYIKNDDFNDLKSVETQADLFSAFHCISAGYDIIDKWDKVLDMVYGLTEISDKTYLKKNDRKSIAKYSVQKIVNLFPLYQSALIMYILGEYEYSGKAFDYLAENGLSGPDILLNSGNCYAAAAIKELDANNRFIFPMELRYNSLLKKYNKISELRSLTKKRIDKEDYIENMISKAKLKFTYLIQTNDKLFEPYISLSGLYYLTGNVTQARNYAIKAEEIAGTSYQKELAQIMKGIIYYDSDKEIAINEFRKAKGNIVADYNLSLIENKNYASKNKELDFKNSPNEKIENIDMLNILYKLDSMKIETFNYDKLDELIIKDFEYKNSKGQILKNKYGNIFWIKTNKKYNGSTSLGIKKNDNIDEVYNLYGKPDKITLINLKKYLIYQDNYLIIEIENGYVKNWMVYKD